MRRIRTALLGTALLAGAALPALAQPAPPPGPTPPAATAPGPGGPGPMMRGPMGPGAGMPGGGPHGPGPHGHGPHGPAALFDRVDANDDGRVTPEEAWGFVQARFAEADRNKDGALVLEEFLATRMMPAPQGAPQHEPDPRQARMRATFFRAMDANRDGRLTQEELRPALDAQLRGLDANGDGGVTLDELPAPPRGRPHGHMHGQPPAPPPPR